VTSERSAGEVSVTRTIDALGNADVGGVISARASARRAEAEPLDVTERLRDFHLVSEQMSSTFRPSSLRMGAEYRIPERMPIPPEPGGRFLSFCY
jgi:hypothetical protein